MLFFVAASCKQNSIKAIQPSFYWWRTVFNPTPIEVETLKQHGVHTLYIKLFDVDWNAARAIAEPMAKSIFQQKPPNGISITPVVFITQEPLQQLDSAGIHQLAVNIARLLNSIAATDSLQLSNEVQLDCDWTVGTKERYFQLLRAVKQQPFFTNKTLSATIRLHQLKFVSQTGVPPVDKGLLMCYNMGNLQHAQTANSIIEEAELKKYISTLPDYPLPLDVALPLFDWWVLFNGNQYKGLLREFEPPVAWKGQGRIQFPHDTVLNGYSFSAGDWLRYEGSDATTVAKAANLVSAKLNGGPRTVILYHLSQRNLAKYTRHELESFFDGFR